MATTKCDGFNTCRQLVRIAVELKVPQDPCTLPDDSTAYMQSGFETFDKGHCTC